ncbi:MAG: DUF86 domain-containing protein [Acidobacteriia bacterium]|nr:DUF86 domain-containing protein [Terriglobia bacterium]
MKDPRVLVLHALECIERVERFTAAGESEFRGNDLIQGAVLHNLQTMAQSIMQLPDAFKASHREVDWRSLVGFRNVLVHDYLGISVPRVWDIVQNDLPAVKVALEAMRRELENA